ncbi:MAG: sensor signal transduction histidine kinase [Bryobacterales bacterium]|nr:sensor signal transduction histidine kinase [Bryobacterales bacterium]
MAEQDPRIEDLLARLAEAEETIRAIYSGEADAVVVNDASGPRVYALEGADHPYRVMVEQMHEGTVTLDCDHVILYSNPQFVEMMGEAFESVTGSEFARFLPPTDAKLFTALVEAAVVRGHGSGELNVRAADGTLVPVRLSVTPLNVAGMQNLCLLVSDLREQRRNVAILKEERLSRLILEQAAEAIVVIDPEGIIVRRSESTRRLSSGPVLMCPFDRVFSLTVNGIPFQTEHILAAARAGENITGVEVKMVHPDGNVSALLFSASPLSSEGNESLGSVITLTDITERKRAEEALARQADELARSNSDLRQFAYSASHDLREPLRQLAVFSELLQAKYQDKLADGASLLIQHAVDSAHRMEGLLKDLLAYTQAADAPQDIAAPSDTGDIVRKTLAIFEFQIAESGAQVECDPLPVLDVHEVHLTQLFQNLIGNALKYRGQAPPHIRISAERADGMWKLAVADNGIGIDPAYQRQVFGLFQRLHGGGKYSGTGIGLAICQKIVQRYGGRIWVESEPGQGSRFIFMLPGEKRGEKSEEKK